MRKQLRNPRRVAYARVSSKEQAENSHALEQQIHRLEREGIPREDIFYDVESGAEADRPQFKRLQEMVRSGEVSEILATRWDRFMRDGSLYQTFKEIVQHYGVQIRLLDQGSVDFKTAAGELHADLQALFAVYERNMLCERISRGYTFRRERKAACSRPPWGYEVIADQYRLNRKPCVCLIADRPPNYRDLYHVTDDSPLLPGLSKADIARDVIETLLRTRRRTTTLAEIRKRYGVPKTRCYKVVVDENGVSKRKQIGENITVAEQLDFWAAPGPFTNWLLNPVLVGDTAYRKFSKKPSRQPVEREDWEIHKNTHPDERLLSDQELEEVKLILKMGGPTFGNQDRVFYLTGLVYCGHCQCKCVLKSGPRQKYYGCRYASTGCSNRKGVRLERIEEAIIQKIVETAASPEGNKWHQRELEKREARIVELQQSLEQMNVLKENEYIREARSSIQQEIDELVQQKDVPITVDSTAIAIMSHPQSRNINFWYTLTQEEREIVSLKLLERVVVRGSTDIEVELKPLAFSSSESVVLR